MNKKNVIFITVDCLRADHIGSYGYYKNITPNIDKLIKKSCLFKNAYSLSSWTGASMVSLLTSTFPFMYDGCLYPCDGRKLISEIVKNEGYATAAVHSNPWLSSFFDYNKGFDFFYDDISSSLNIFKKNKSVKSKFKNLFLKILSKNKFFYNLSSDINLFINGINNPYLNAEKINKISLKWIENNKKNFFLWIHYMDVHEPHFSPLENLNYYNSKEVIKINKKLKKNPQGLSNSEIIGLINNYDDEIKYVDSQIGKLIEYLRELNLLKETYLVISSDHGEQFNEHGDFRHGLFLYNELIHVPLIIFGPDIPKKIINSSVSSIDISPTILDFFNIKKPSSYLGESLLKTINNEKIKPNDVFSEEGRKKRGWFIKTNKSEAFLDKSEKKIALIEGDFKYIYNERYDDELYNIRKDIHESINLINSEKNISLKLKKKILNHIKDNNKYKYQIGEKLKIKRKIKLLINEGKFN